MDTFVGAALEFENVSVLAYLIAFVGGMISFLSPCVLPMAPAYIAMVSGLDLATLEQRDRHNWSHITATTGAFIAGFGAVFTLLGVSASAIGRLLFEHQVALTRFSGGVMIAMALFMLGSIGLKSPWMYQERRFHPRFGKFGKFAPFVMGAAFGFGWSPCIGPTLTSVLTIAASEGRTVAGATLMITYSAGLGLPFLAIGFAAGRLGTAIGFIKRHFAAVVVCSSLVLAGFGLLLLTDNLVSLTARLSELLEDSPLEWITKLG